MELTISKGVFDSVPEQILVINVEDFKVVDANRALLEAVGLKRQDVLGKKCFEITHHRSLPCNAPNDVCPIAEMLKTGKPKTVEHTHFDKAGNPFYVEVSASPITDEHGKITHAIHMSRDISERKRLEFELLRFKLGVEQAGEAIFLTGFDGTIVYANPMFEIVYGYSKEETLGKTPRILKSGVLPQESYKQFWAALLAGKPIASQIINKSKSGQYLTIEANTNPIIDKAGKTLGFLAIHRDITAKADAGGN